jgi:hypothetical protein
MIFVAITWFCHTKIEFILIKKYYAIIQRWFHIIFQVRLLELLGQLLSSGFLKDAVIEIENNNLDSIWLSDRIIVLKKDQP